MMDLYSQASANPLVDLWGEMTEVMLHRTFYHKAIVPLLALSIILAWFARPSTKEEIPSGFRAFQYTYLAVWCICVSADWLQGPYVYALYSAYGFSSHEIAQLFVAGFGSSLVFGCLVGSVADRFGRKKTCLAYCVLYMVSCMTKHCKHYGVLMIGRVTGGIATSMLFSVFECWMVSEHLGRRGWSSGLLSYMFGLMYTLMYFVAIASGLAAQVVADNIHFRPVSEGSIFYVGGFCCPFDMAIACLCVGMVLIATLWPENYGSEGEAAPSLMGNVGGALQLLKTDKRTMLLCVVVSCFEGAMFTFVFNWTPALESKVVPPPYGVIFALFMMCCMSGASAATILGKALKPSQRLMLVFMLGTLSFITAAKVGGQEAHLALCFAAFLVFEFCCGVYFPSIGILKSEIVPEQVRGTVYNIYRIPLNGLVVILLLNDLSMQTVFELCGALLMVAAAAVTAITHLSGPQPAFGKEAMDATHKRAAKEVKEV